MGRGEMRKKGEIEKLNVQINVSESDSVGVMIFK